MIHRSFWRCPSRWLVLLLLAAAAGCTPSVVPVEGVLTWDDGKPVAGANIRLVPTSGAKEAVGYTDEQGAFKLTSVDGAGALPGNYKVVVSKSANTGGSKTEVIIKGGDKSGDDFTKAMKSQGEKLAKGGSQAPRVTDPVPDVYGSETSTPLQVAVDGRKLELKISKK